MLNQARQEFKQPYVAHFTIFINNDFDVTTLIPKIKRAVHHQPLLFAYSIEKASKLHVHLMLVLDCQDDRLNPRTAFYSKALQAILSLKNVEGCDLNERKIDSERPTPKIYTHDLKDFSDFKDAVHRYSYISKSNDKQALTAQYKKLFASSQIKSSKYFHIKETDNMIIIKQARVNESLNFSTNKVVNERYINCRKTAKDDTETKYCFHLLDINTNKSVGFYGYSFDHELLDDNNYNIYITVNDLYIRNTTSLDFANPIFNHLEERLKMQILQLKNTLQDNQSITIHVVPSEYTELDTLLSAVLLSVQDDLALNLGLGV